MVTPAATILVFGLYLLGLGFALMLVPNLLLSTFGLPSTDEIWVRVVGMLVLFLGAYDLGAARGRWMGFIVLSVPLRLSVIAFFAAFVLLAGAPWMLLLFGVVDFVFAMWTWFALKHEVRTRVRRYA